MSTVSNFMFNNLGRLDADPIDNSQQNLQNTRFANYQLASYFSDTLSNSHIAFATAQPAIMISGSVGPSSISSGVIDIDSALLIKKEQERPLDKLQLSQRPFLTIPYLGRGSCDPTLESQLQQGEVVSDKKSVSTVMEKSFMGYTIYPSDDNMTARSSNASSTVEEAAMSGWTRGGASSREIYTDKSFSNTSRPTDRSY